jgi:uncharacterized protein YcbX
MAATWTIHLLHGGVLGLITLLVLSITTTLAAISLFYYSGKEQHDEPHVPGCRRLGLVGRSNMSDQYSPKYNGKNLLSSTTCNIKALFIYPVKSCGFVELEDSHVVLTGLRYDRQFCFAQLKTEQADKDQRDLNVSSQWLHNWKFITQRNVPRLSQVATQVWIPDPSCPTYSPEAEWVKSKGCVVCSFPFTPECTFDLQGLKSAFSMFKTKIARRDIRAEPQISFKLPIAPDAQRASKYQREAMNIWKDSPTAINMTSEISPDTLAKLKYFLGLSNPLALFQADAQNHRPVFRNAPTKDEAGFQPGVGFADAYPLSIMGLASVQEVSLQVKNLPTAHLDALRFRANIYCKLLSLFFFFKLASSLTWLLSLFFSQTRLISDMIFAVSGTRPFAEDAWKIIRSGNLDYHVSCRTTRCDLPNVDPLTGIKDRQEPYRTLKQIRGNIDKGAGAHPVLGMQMVPLVDDAKASQEIRVGAEMKVIETGEHLYIRMFQD